MNISSPIFIRCDSSTDIGSGHVMRCLNLALSLKNEGATAIFICQNLVGNVSSRIRDAGFEVIFIPTTTNYGFHLNEIIDAEETHKIINRLSNCKKNKPLLIADHYGIGIEWQNYIKPSTNLVVIDDLADHKHNANIIINQNLYSKGATLYKSLANKDALILTGPQYSLLSSYFVNARPQKLLVKQNIERIIITFGGSDQDNNTLKALKATLNVVTNNVLVDVVVGQNHPDKKSLKDISETHSNVILHDYILNFAAFLKDCDLMIGAGGVTQWERSCLGIPGIILSIADNQTKVAQNIAAAGAGIYVGWHEDVQIEKIKHTLRNLIDNFSLRQSIAQTSYNLNDGNGAKRITEILLLTNGVSLHLVTQKDSELLFQWRNHEEIRKYSHNSAIIERSDHEQWFSNSLKNYNRHILIAQKDKNPVGVVRFDIEDKIATISIYLNPDFIGQGIGTILLKISAEWLTNNRSEVSVIQAIIKNNNQRSIKTFLASGYSKRGDYYEFDLKRR
jgi:UDP-2,4-diacetamido-2,4,6-trideoxy-beta-L-altropyranose hydrolase